MGRLVIGPGAQVPGGPYAAQGSKFECQSVALQSNNSSKGDL